RCSKPWQTAATHCTRPIYLLHPRSREGGRKPAMPTCNSQPSNRRGFGQLFLQDWHRRRTYSKLRPGAYKPQAETPGTGVELTFRLNVVAHTPTRETCVSSG